MATKSDETVPCIEVQVLWGASVLHVAHLAPSRSFHVGEQGSGGAACDCFVPASALGVMRAPVFVAGDGDTVQLVILPAMTGTVRLLGSPPRSVAELLTDAVPYAAIEGARVIDLPRGASARLEIGGVVFVVTSAAPAPPIADLRKLRTRSVPFWMGSGLLHLGLLGSLSCFPASPSAGASGRTIAAIELKYKDRLSKKNVVEEVPIQIAFAGSDAASAATIDASVARPVQGFAAGEALTTASWKIANGDRDGATALLTERESILRAAAETLHEPLFLRDADRLARLRASAGSRTGSGDPLVLAMLLETAGRTHLR